MAEPEYRLTTIDNPYNPFTQFDSWFLYDVEKGYNTCGLLARISKTSPELSDEENTEETNQAIDEIIKTDFMNIYRRVKREDPIPKETDDK
jgi:hypothetical protein